MARLVLAALLCLPACASRPRAPELDEGTSFRSARERLSFTLPEGWSQQARAAPPSGRIDRERLLVLYRRSAPRATFAVTLIDLAGDDLESYVKKQLADGLPWRLSAPAESCHVGSRRGRRFVLSAKGPDGPLLREVVAVRRDGRVYFFATTRDRNDGDTRDRVRKTLAGVSWD
jgi:hypothetical protein